jgi:EAL domain-containing protein (putative c-di-GMP-specific phosphodiesterase class I)/GGDEF domain-containing protein
VLDAWQEARSQLEVGWVPLLLLLLLGFSAAVVYASGGTRTAALHIVYLPILLGAFWYGLPGGIVMSILGGLTVGPLMPLNVAEGEMQPALNWLVRMAFMMLIGSVAGVALGTLRDYSHRLREQAFFSRETHMPTGHRLAVDVQERLRSREGLRQLAVIQAGNFDAIANTVGFETAHRLPAAIQRRLAPVLGPNMICYELAADRVAVAEFGGGDPLLPLAETVLDQLRSPVGLGRTAIYVEAQVGVYRAEPDDVEPGEILRRASSALFIAREQGVAVAAYSPAVDENARANQRLMENLVSGLEQGRLFLEYQPRIELSTGQIVGVEALLRLRGRDGQLIPPGRFIPLAEGSNVIHELTRRVIAEAVSELASWRAAGRDLRMAINFSTRNLQNDGALDYLVEVCARHEVPHDRIELEVTESAMVRDPEAFHRVIGEARARGFHVAIDDFGTGYTTLGSLSVLPINTLKLDRSLVVHMQTRQNGFAVIESVVNLCKNLGFRIVAEGIENSSCLSRLLEAGCEEGQGFLMARPMTAAALERWLLDTGGRYREDIPAHG